MSQDSGEEMQPDLPIDHSTRPRPMHAIALTTIAGLLRLIPHPWNFTPQGAIEVFAGARLPLWQGLALPIVLRLVTDSILFFSQKQLGLGLYLTFLPWVYGSMLVSVGMGRLLRNSNSPSAIGVITLASSMQFFLVTNFGSWIGSEMYPHTFSGLMQSYLMGWPFFKPALAGSCVYSVILFGAAALLAMRNTARSNARSIRTGA